MVIEEKIASGWAGCFTVLQKPSEIAQKGKQVVSAAALLLSTILIPGAQAQIIVPGPIEPVSKICADWQALYPNTQITDNGDGIATTVAGFPNRIYTGYRDDWATAKNTLVIYNSLPEPEPVWNGADWEACWYASVDYVKGDPGLPYNAAVAPYGKCYSSVSCAPVVRPRVIGGLPPGANLPPIVALPPPTVALPPGTIVGLPPITNPTLIPMYPLIPAPAPTGTVSYPLLTPEEYEELIVLPPSTIPGITQPLLIPMY